MKSQRIRPSELLKLRKETGRSYWDLVGNPLPKIEEYGNGKSASNFLMATTGPYSDVIDDTIDQYLAAGWTPTEVAGLVGNVALESGFNPNAVDSAGYRGLYQMSRDMHNSYNQVASAYKKSTGKNYSYTQFIDDMMRGNSRIPSRWITYGKGYLGRNWKSPEAAANAFMNIFERPNPKYANKVGRQANAADAYQYILRRLLNKLMGLLGVEQSDATRVAKPVIQVSRLRKPKQTEDAPIILLQDDEPTAPIQDVPITSGFTLPNPIQLYNNIFGTNLPTMNGGKDKQLTTTERNRAEWEYRKKHPFLGQVRDNVRKLKSGFNDFIDNNLYRYPLATALSGIGGRALVGAAKLYKNKTQYNVPTNSKGGYTTVLDPWNEIITDILDKYGKFLQTPLGQILPFSHGKDSGIHIKPSHRGRFTRYLKNHPGMTAEKAKHSKNASVRRMATFALNARKWNN